MDQLISQRLAQFVGMHEGVSFARGSAGLYGLLSALARKDGAGEVIIPSLCCESVALAAVYAGHEVRFGDISKETLGISKDTIAPLMSSRTRAVIAVHLFGIDAEVEQFAELRRKYPSVVFVEDIAHAIGARNRMGTPLGCQLDCALLSFAADKILPGNGGMLLLAENSPVSRDDIVARIPVDAALLPQPHLSLSLRNLVHGIADSWRADSTIDGDSMFLPALQDYRDVIVCGGGIADVDLLESAVDGMEAARLARLHRHEQYRDKIDSALVFPIAGNGNCWRSPVLFDERRRAQAATRQLRVTGINASNHYFPLHLLFRVDHCPAAEDVATRIVNLWVDDSVSENLIDRTADIINSS